MVVGKLRMKNAHEPSAAPTSGTNSKRRCRHATRSPSVDPAPPPYGYTAEESIDVFPSGSSFASRSYRESKGKHPVKDPEIGDELVINWTTTSSEIANRLLSMPSQNDREFKLKLQDALKAEDDIRFESLVEEDYRLPERWKYSESHRHAQTDMDGHRLGMMGTEEYDEYIRKRMWSRTNRTQYLRSKDQEAKDRKTHERAAQSRAQQKLELEKKEILRAQKETRRKEKQMKRSRNSFQQRWEIINSLQISRETGKDDLSFIDDTQQILREDEVPWPIYPQEPPDGCSLFLAPRLDQLTPDSIKEFLLGHLAASDLAAKRKVIRTALLAYHPDRFERLVKRIKDIDGAQSKVRELGLRVSQILNELNHRI